MRRPAVPLLLLPLVRGALQPDATTCAASVDAASTPERRLLDEGELASAASLQMLQVESAARRSAARTAGEPQREDVASAADRDLVLQHIPYNFGHTIEKIGAVGNGGVNLMKYGLLVGLADNSAMAPRMKWPIIENLRRPDGAVWGHLYPELAEISEVTKCPLYFTPGKYWPKDLAQKYFGNKTIFGMLRDPYERLVAMFRGNFGGYGGSYPEFVKNCDVNGAVRQMMQNYLAGRKYAENCTFVPQAEYFDEPFGITLAVDNRKFPASMNAAFKEHGYENFKIEDNDVLHVLGCTEIWAGDLDCETKAMVRKVYARDFELLCKNFGYCDASENTCIEGVAMMCPSNLEEKRRTATVCK